MLFDMANHTTTPDRNCFWPTVTTGPDRMRSDFDETTIFNLYFFVLPIKQNSG
jgi:hypothetical protein